jgi:hypothetical protein
VFFQSIHGDNGWASFCWADPFFLVGHPVTFLSYPVTFLVSIFFSALPFPAHRQLFVSPRALRVRRGFCFPRPRWGHTFLPRGRLPYKNGKEEREKTRKLPYMRALHVALKEEGSHSSHLLLPNIF